MRGPIFAVRGAPYGHVDRLLLDLIADFQDAKKSARRARANIHGRAVAAFLYLRSLRDQIEFHGHAIFPSDFAANSNIGPARRPRIALLALLGSASVCRVGQT